MSNVHGLFSNRNDDSDDSDNENRRYVGGVSSRGGGRYVKLYEKSIFRQDAS